MKLLFRINYRTEWGEQLYVVGNIPELGDNDAAKALAMNFSHDEEWWLELEIPATKAKKLEYQYVLKNHNDGTMTKEWGAPRSVVTKTGVDTVLLIDAWNSVSAVENTFMTAPFVDVLLKENYTPCAGNNDKAYTHTLRVKAPLLAKNEALCIVGDCEALGAWSVDKPLLLSNKEYPMWTINLDLSKATSDIHYKYGVYNTENNCFIRFEYGQDRIVPPASGTR
ncbi:MAG: 4-alpha-glucanotransferase, partial [Paludibacteraceae bacterium]|nr:4-alpha-glucanotransferase [Paludibacteraceae bacterium]